MFLSVHLPGKAVLLYRSYEICEIHLLVWHVIRGELTIETSQEVRSLRWMDHDPKMARPMVRPVAFFKEHTY